MKIPAKTMAAAVFILILFAAMTITVNAQIDRNETAIIDYTNTPSTGTVSIKLAQTAAPLTARVRIEKDDMQYDYILRNDGIAEVFPLQMGNGEYSVRVLLGPVPDGSGRFALVLSSSFILNLRDPNVVFLQSHQLVNFNGNSQLAAKTAELVRETGAGTDLQIAETIYRFVVDEFEYDFDKAQRVIQGEASGYMPVLDEILTARKGVCFDYAALFAAMLRSQNIPAKLVMGNVVNPDPKAPAGSMIYHAWNEFYSRESGTWVRVNEMRFNGNRFERLDPTFDSTSRGSQAAMQFIANDANYIMFKKY